MTVRCVGTVVTLHRCAEDLLLKAEVEEATQLLITELLAAALIVALLVQLVEELRLVEVPCCVGSVVCVVRVLCGFSGFPLRWFPFRC